MNIQRSRLLDPISIYYYRKMSLSVNSYLHITWYLLMFINASFRGDKRWELITAPSQCMLHCICMRIDIILIGVCRMEKMTIAVGLPKSDCGGLVVVMVEKSRGTEPVQRKLLLNLLHRHSWFFFASLVQLNPVCGSTWTMLLCGMLRSVGIGRIVGRERERKIKTKTV